MIKPIQTLRGIFAVFIFLHHFAHDVETTLFDVMGDFGVAFFFVLSGFVISQAYLSDGRRLPAAPKQFGRFICRRLAKIYPLHVVCLAIALIFISFDARSIGFYVLNLLLLQCWVPDEYCFYCGNSIGWCVSDIFFFYLAFPFLASLIKKKPAIFITVATAITLVYAYIIIPHLSAEMLYPIVYISPATRLLDFVVGMILWQIYDRIRNRPLRPLHVALLTALTLTVCIITSYRWFYIPRDYAMSIIWWPTVSLIILSAVLIKSPLLSPKLLVRFGDISFTFYLIHFLVITLCRHITHTIGLQLSVYAMIPLSFVATLIFAIIIHRAFVGPIERLIREKI